jgi:hypothetical protein
MIEAGFQQDTKTVACVDTITGTFDVPIDITLAAQPTNGLAEGENDFDMQIVFTITEETISGLLGDVVEIATIGESSSDVASDNVDDTMLVKVSEAPVPCTVDFTADPDNNGMAGPINIVTPVTTGTFTVADPLRHHRTGAVGANDTAPRRDLHLGRAAQCHVQRRCWWWRRWRRLVVTATHNNR